MDNFHNHIKKVVLFTTVVMLLVIGAWIVDPRPIFVGFVLGSTVSIINTYIIYRHVSKVTEIQDGKNTNGQQPIRLSGMGWRVFFVVVAVIYADRTAEIDVFATVFGAFFAQIVAYIYLFFNAYSTRNLKGGKM